jgi:phospholipid N-methyltransferase
MSRSSKRLFLKKFIAQPSINASIIPSSQALSRLMIQNIDWSTIDTVIEFGPGTGVFTKYIIKHAKPNTKVILLEFDQDYCQFLKDKFGEQVVIIS